jgi:transposase
MKLSEAILSRWRHTDPDRLLEAALRQARVLAEVVPELESLRRQNATLSQQLEIQTKRLAQLEEALQEAERAAHRQAAPFRIEEKKRVLTPRSPGRKHGHPGAFRHPPDHIDQAIEAPLCACPHCGATEFIDPSRIEQFIEDIPAVRPHVTRLTTYQATCTRCGRHVRSRHPLQMSLAAGTAAVQLGPRALALAADLGQGQGALDAKNLRYLARWF